MEMYSMEIEYLRKILESVRDGNIGIDEALTKLKNLPFEDLGFAKLMSTEIFVTDTLR